MGIDSKSAAEVLSRARFSHLDENGLQAAIANELRAAFPDAAVRREVRIGQGERIDLLADRLGIEVKVAGSVGAVRRQLVRYANSGVLDELLLVSTRVAHRAVTDEFGRVPVMVVTPRWL